MQMILNVEPIPVLFWVGAPKHVHIYEIVETLLL